MFQSKTLARLLCAAGAALIAMALVVPAASAGVTKPGYEYWSGCPTAAENPEVVLCIRNDITGGHFQMGNKDVPITNTMTLTGGLNSKFQFDGELTPVKQLVPGGIIGLTGLDWLVDFLNLEGLKLYAVTELAGEPHVIKEPLELPIKVHLINPVLGNNCYVGSDSAPIKLNLITETTNPPPPNEPISGVAPEVKFNEPPGSSTAKDGLLVDNSFAAPGANGCKLILFGFIPISINGLVNTASGLPSPAGTNETTQTFDVGLVPRFFVY